ncbi:MAG: outer membrane lipoprotein carrier protein LolA [Bacteroidales bacterium]|nr:outer membrane lipoprotein carrier protein LolA [Bacteroidales bacterium]MDD4603081.1 outer membrane lipoprotein carrier protein LolA [Bacteroidales bacterium]
MDKIETTESMVLNKSQNTMRITLMGMLLLFTFIGNCQTKDAKAIAILEEVSAKTKSYKSIKVEFAYTMVNTKAKINEEKSGSLLISGDKYKMNAAGQTVFCDGKTIWTYLKESNEVQVNSLDNKDDALTPSKLLTSYNSNYKSKIIKSNDPAVELIELVPNVSKNFSKAILGVDKLKKQIKSFSIFDKSGNVFTYKIKTFITNAPVSTADFSFDEKKFPGVEVIDMR